MHECEVVLLKEFPWLFTAATIENIIKIEPISFSRSFIASFPSLSMLLSKASRFQLIIRETKKRGKTIEFGLFCWGEGNTRRGWLCPPPQKLETQLPPNYKILLNEFGGIVESFGLDDDQENYLINMEEVFCPTDFVEPFASHLDYYETCCELFEKEKSINFADWIIVAEEANGNTILCNKNTEELLLFAPDHDFDYVVVYDDCPEYTFYRIKDCPTFQSWVEACAIQWLI
ncbi:hypothetical protein [Enterococcus sp. AZ007]|uniref:hypothetical protein n=1 Tax=Enterococcus sp. AZ007 TaxID=2774839 RepID=UPI003F2835E7